MRRLLLVATTRRQVRCRFCSQAIEAWLPEQAVHAERIAYPHNVARRIVVKPNGKMEIQLLIVGQMIQPTGVQELTWTSTLRINMPLRPQPSCSSNDHGNCRYG